MSTESDAGSNDLAMLRDTTSKVLLAVVWLHVPIAMAIGLMRGISSPRSPASSPIATIVRSLRARSRWRCIIWR